MQEDRQLIAAQHGGVYFSYDLSYFPPPDGAASSAWQAASGKVNPELLRLSTDRAALRSALWDSAALTFVSAVSRPSDGVAAAAARRIISQTFLGPRGVVANFTQARAIPLDSPRTFQINPLAFRELDDLAMALDAAAMAFSAGAPQLQELSAWLGCASPVSGCPVSDCSLSSVWLSRWFLSASCLSLPMRCLHTRA
jgi:hypothetical protein